ncbi:MAG TPA: hypothetical protein VKU60_11185 [Chloroflexota bacterium]|nr:hypothetical protein [Chloroflexota bacterium]
MIRFSAVKQALLAAATALLLIPTSAQAAARPAPPCDFVLGFKILHDALPSTVGACKDNQFSVKNGDAQQGTDKGLLVWRKSDNFTAFTDGFRSWVNGPLGIQQRLNSERFPWEHDAALPAGSTGFDISYPQCSAGGAPSGGFGIVGATGGRPFSANPCAGGQFSAFAAQGKNPGLYMNTGFLDKYKSHITAGCRASVPGISDGGLADAWAMGCSEAENAVANAPGAASMWWLDVETENSWSDIKVLNQYVIQGAVSYLSGHGFPVGIYSNPKMWATITGGNSWTPTGLTATWVAPGKSNAGNASSFCSYNFATVPVYMVQYVANNLDTDYAC